MSRPALFITACSRFSWYCGAFFFCQHLSLLCIRRLTTRVAVVNTWYHKTVVYRSCNIRWEYFNTALDTSELVKQRLTSTVGWRTVWRTFHCLRWRRGLWLLMKAEPWHRQTQASSCWVDVDVGESHTTADLSSLDSASGDWTPSTDQWPPYGVGENFTFCISWTIVPRNTKNRTLPSCKSRVCRHQTDRTCSRLINLRPWHCYSFLTRPPSPGCWGMVECLRSPQLLTTWYI